MEDQKSINDFVQEYGLHIFNFGVGFFLISAETIPAWLGWSVTGLTVILSGIAILQFGTFTTFWNLVIKHSDRFSPNGDLNDRGKIMFDYAVSACYGYRFKMKFWYAVSCNVVLLAGMIRQELWIAFAIEALAFVIVYSFIRSFLTHFNVYYKIIKGQELDNA